MLATLLSLLFIANANAATAIGSGPGVCSTSNPYYDSDATVKMPDITSSSTQSLIYDLSEIKMNGDILEIYGWAFNTQLDTDLGGVTTSGRTSDDAYVNFVLSPSDGSGDIPFTVQYATPGSSSPKYYNLTYWNCVRSSDGAEVNVNGTQYTTGGYCINKQGDSNNKRDNTYGDTMPLLQGGFKASIDLSTLPENKTYTVKMQFTHNNPANTVSSTYKTITGNPAVVDPSVDAYTGPSTLVNGLQMAIDISGFKDKDKVSVVVGSGRLLSSDGLYCNSIATGNRSTTKYQKSTYTIGPNVVRACRGGTPNCSSSSAGSINLYELYVNPSTGAPGSTGGAYAPATWLNFQGTFTISTMLERAPETPQEKVPTVCNGQDIYYFYYFFLASLNDAYGGTAGKWMTTSADATKFGDYEILEDLGFNSNSEMAKEEGIYYINKDNLNWYYTKLKSATSSSDRYIKEGNKYYIAYDSWCAVLDDGSTKCYDAISGCELNADGSINTTSSACANPGFVNNGNFDITEYMNATVNLDVPPDGQDALQINAIGNSTGLGYKFGIKRFFKGYTSGRRSMLDITQKAVPTSNGQELHPAVYLITFCKASTPQCDDEVDPAVCLDNDVGTEVVFHENNDLKTCTIPKGNNSGFTIIESSETENPAGDSYCQVACKEDLDIELPGGKETAAGQYFLLDNYVPKISATRTCVTTEIDYDDFDSDLTTIETELKRLYNIWQDYADYLSVLNNITPTAQPVSYRQCCDCWGGCSSGYVVYVSSSSSFSSVGNISNAYVYGTVDTNTINALRDNGVIVYRSYNITTIQNDLDSGNIDAVLTNSSNASLFSDIRSICQCESGTYTKYTWSVAAKTYPNSSLSFAADSGVEGGTCGVSCYGTTRCANELTAKRADIQTKTTQAKNNYVAKLNEYKNTINAYNACFSWIDNTMNATVTGTTISATSTTLKGNYLYSFEPTVTFYYPDTDGQVFPVPYTYVYGTDVDKVGFDITNTYWTKGSTVDNSYSSGGSSTSNKEYRGILKCTNGSCSMDTTVYFYTNNYIRRDESVTYTYHLPAVYSTIPDGKVHNYKPSSEEYVTLEDESVPININTRAGTYDYSITISGLKDTLRESKETKNPDDDWDDRFNGNGSTGIGALNAGDEYVCTYDVVNDIYIPGPNIGDPGKLNFFYRVVDLNDINPNNRTLGYNWSDSRGDSVRSRMASTAADYTLLTASANNAKFEFTLTPAIMKEIRSYNATQSRYGGSNSAYADWDLNCDDYDTGGYHCYSNFLTCLASGGRNYETGYNCNMFGSSLNNYSRISDYTDTDLNTNRTILINKQNALDGR